MFLAPNFFEGAPPEFLKSIYKIQSDSDHVVKFQGDWSRELGESVAKQKKHVGQNISPSGTVVPGGLIMFKKTSKFIKLCKGDMSRRPKQQKSICGEIIMR